MSQQEYDPRNMRFRRLGPSGLRVSLFSLGGWLTIGGSVQDEATKEIMKAAYERGVNTFDTAEVYANGQCEISMGKAIKELGWQREPLVLITKIFYGTGAKDPNATGLSRKHIIEGANASLKRAGLEYWDIILAHSPDVTVPMVEVVKAFNQLIQQGKCFYWGTSAWSAEQISEAYGIAEKLGLDPPLADQSQYSALHREPVEKDYLPLYQKHGMGLTIWSPLAWGLLTGKYADGIPKGSRFDVNKDSFGGVIDSLKTAEGQAKLEKVRKLSEIAKELGCSVAVLAIAWAAKNEHVSTVILGASKPEQIIENLTALDYIDKLTPDVLAKIEAVLANKPEALPTFGRA
ncbi:voltage-gated potassium channel beta-2 subunit [Ceraceosorus bombacis]|uniref:Voltage-gated potassium channel beta-2 subunit n=1 Tax=Ceraceosorus bombacis TaxID=401625 RepID=A0A0P1BIK9_9BASI|nr:voltage-gated potassium channel beta-2 subunit [Ceraceosorus bombacis]